MGYELKPDEELLKKEQEEREKYGDVKMELENDLPVYKDMGAAGIKSSNMSHSGRRIIFMILGLVLAVVFIILVKNLVSYMVASGGEDISDYLNFAEEDLAKQFDLTFEDNADRAKMIPQYSGGKVLVRSADGLEVIYINDKLAGVGTNSRKYRFYGVGINEPGVDLEKLCTFEHDETFVVSNDIIEGHSSAYFFANRAKNRCVVYIVNENSNRVVYMAYYNNFSLISQRLVFDD